MRYFFRSPEPSNLKFMFLHAGLSDQEQNKVKDFLEPLVQKYKDDVLFHWGHTSEDHNQRLLNSLGVPRGARGAHTWLSAGARSMFPRQVENSSVYGGGITQSFFFLHTITYARIRSNTGNGDSQCQERKHSAPSRGKGLQTPHNSIHSINLQCCSVASLTKPVIFKSSFYPRRVSSSKLLTKGSIRPSRTSLKDAYGKVGPLSPEGNLLFVLIYTLTFPEERTRYFHVL